jgi:alpha-beta hydrolase superfamily lysophospholipase
MRASLTATGRLVLAGAVLAAALGTGAGAALRPEAAERGPAAAPQQMILTAPELAMAEAAGGGWPARAQALRGA